MPTFFFSVFLWSLYFQDIPTDSAPLSPSHIHIHKLDSSSFQNDEGTSCRSDYNIPYALS